MTAAVDNRLTATGVAVLLAFWEDLRPPQADCVFLADDDAVAVTAATTEDLARARKVCQDAGLAITGTTYGFVVRRRRP